MEMSDDIGECKEDDHKGVNKTKSGNNDQQTNEHATNDEVGEHENVDQSTDKDKRLEAKALDGGWGWFVVLGSFLMHSIMAGFERSSGIIYLQLLTHFNGSSSQTTWIFAMFSGFRLIFATLASALCNRFSIRTVVIAGAIMCFVGMMMSAFSLSLSFLYLTYGTIAGIGSALVYSPSLIIVGYYFKKRLGLAVGLATSGTGVGTFVFPPIFEILFENHDFKGAFLILAAIIGHYLICGFIFRPIEQQQMALNSRGKESGQQCTDNDDEQSNNTNSSSDPHSRETVWSGETPSTSVDALTNTKTRSLRSTLCSKFSRIKKAFMCSSKTQKKQKGLLNFSLLKNFTFVCLCIQIHLFTLSFHTTFTFLPAIAKENGISQLQGAFLVSILGTCDALSRISLSVILDFKNVKPYRLIIYNIVIFVLAGISFSVPFLTKFWEFALVSALYGAMSGLYISHKSVVCIDVLGVENLASSFGLFQTFQGVGSLIGQTTGGMLKDALGSYKVTFFFGSLATFLGGITMAIGNMWMQRQRKLKE